MQYRNPVKDVIIVRTGTLDKSLRNNPIKKRESKTLPEGMTLGQMEEVFTERLANLIVRLWDYRHEQKLNAQATGESRPEDNNKKHA